MAKSETHRARLTKPENEDTREITRIVLNALNSSDTVKACFKPGDLSMKAGAGTYVVIMQSGAIYRLQLAVLSGNGKTE